MLTHSLNRTARGPHKSHVEGPSMGTLPQQSFVRRKSHDDK